MFHSQWQQETDKGLEALCFKIILSHLGLSVAETNMGHILLQVAVYPKLRFVPIVYILMSADEAEDLVIQSISFL